MPELYEYDDQCISSQVVIRLECKLLCPDAKLPTKVRATDAGYDIYTVDSGIINPHTSKSFGTGLALTCPPGWYYSIAGRSGLFTKGIWPNVGTIDATYNGPLTVQLNNGSDTPYEVHKFDRVAQILLHRIHQVDIVIVDQFSAEYISDRGTNGFGSSGR